MRRDHNFVTRTSIDEVAAAFWPVVDRLRIEAVLDSLDPAARAYWNLPTGS